MKSESNAEIPATAEARLALGLCPVHGVELTVVGRGAGGNIVADCPVRNCKVSAIASGGGGQFELLKSVGEIDSPKRISRTNAVRYKSGRD